MLVFVTLVNCAFHTLCGLCRHEVHVKFRKNILLYIQQDATLHSLFISGNFSTCFGWYLHPSSGAHTTIYSIWYLSHRYCYLPQSWKSWNRFECAVGGVRHPQHTQTSFCSLTLSNTSSFLTWSVQLIFSILLQHHISKLSRCFWSITRSVQVSAPYKAMLQT